MNSISNLLFRGKKSVYALVVLFLSLHTISWGQTYVIPTVVHIISPSSQNNLLSDTEVQVGIDNINKQFSGEYATNIINTVIPQHQSFINNSNIKFELASIDPSGNTTNGITRTVNSSWSTAGQSYELNYKSALGWDRAKYFNVYVVETFNSNNQSGVAYRPGGVSSAGDAVKDGAMVTYRIWPVSFSLDWPQWDGFEGTLAHEFGHYLNLSHTWGQTNSATSCSNPICDDFVGDTPKQAGTLDGFIALQQTTGCNGEIAMTDNFMSYSRHQCLFTPGQVSRMHAALQSSVSSRNNLWSATNLAATGTGSGTNPPPAGYCSAAGAPLTDTDFIDNVSIGSIDNNSGKTPYSDFTSISTNVVKGNSYAITVQIDTDWGQDQAYAWADWNDDQVFDNGSELITFTPYSNTIATGTMTVPANAVNGSVRLRVRNIYATPNLPEPCGDIYGEVEDYTLNIVTGSNTYCLAGGASGTGDDYITNVSIGTINNNSGKTPYSDFTSQSTTLEQGLSYSISIEIGTAFSPDQAYAWADWNDDQIFDNSELISFGGYSSEVATGTITVPNNSVTGSIRLRVRNIYATPNLPEPCGDIYGEVEDYTLDIISPPASYCVAEGASGTGDDYITNVSIGTIDNNSGKTPYSDFTSQSTPLDKGQSYSISVRIETAFTPDQAYAWVDWDGDLVFENNELISFSGYNNDVATGTITVPSNANIGAVRLRVRNLYATPNIADPCGAIYGEVEDYTLNIQNTSPPCSNLISDSFENGFANWNDGGNDVRRIDTFANTGNYSIRLRDNSGSASSMYSDPLDLSTYNEATIDFSFYPNSMENGEDFFLELSLDGGITYNIIQTWARGTHFSNNNRYNESVVIPGSFTANTVFRFRCDASGNRDYIYIDDVHITACVNQSQARTKNPALSDTSLPKPELKDLFVDPIQSMKVYPNPVSGTLFFELEELQELNARVFIYNTTGQFISETDLNGKTSIQNIEVNHLPDGIYLLRIVNTETSTAKIKRIIIRNGR